MDNHIVGYAQFFKKESDRVHLNEIAVSRDQQGQGIGTALMKFVEESSRELEVSFIELFCTEINENAKMFYRNCNYEIEKYLLVKEL